MGQAIVWFNSLEHDCNSEFSEEPLLFAWSIWSHLAVLSHLNGEDDLNKMGFKRDFDWSQPPSKKFKKVKVPHLVASSYSSSCETDEHEDLDDTAAGPTSTNNPDNAGAPPSTWNSSGALVLIFDPFGHLMTKGEKFELVFKRVYLRWAFFSKVATLVLLKTLLDRVVNLNSMVTWYFCCFFCMLIPH